MSTRRKPILARIKSSLSVNLDGRDDDGLSIYRSIGTHLIGVLSVRTVVSELEIEVELEIYQRSTPSAGCKDLRIRKSKFVAETQFLYYKV